MDYLNAMNAGAKSSVDLINYPQQQQLATEQARANVVLTKQSIKENDLTFQQKMLQLQAAKRKEEQDAMIAANARSFQIGEDTSTAEAGTKASNDSKLVKFLRSQGEYILKNFPSRAKEAEEYLKSADAAEKNSRESSKVYTELKSKQLETQSKAALSVRDAASLKQAGDILASMNARPSDWPTEWNDKAKIYMKNLSAATDAQRDAMKIEAELGQKRAQTAHEYSNIAKNNAEIKHWNNQDKLARDKFEAQTDDSEKYGGMTPSKALAQTGYSKKVISDAGKQVKLNENLSIVRDVNNTFLDETGRVKPAGARTPADTESLLWAFIQVNKPERMGSTKMVEQMNKDLTSLPMRIGNKVVTLVAGKRLDDTTVAALVKNINEKVKARNEEVMRIEDAEVDRLVKRGWDRATAEGEIYGLADRSSANEVQSGLQALSPASQKVINDYAKAHGLSPEVAYQIYLDKTKK